MLSKNASEYVIILAGKYIHIHLSLSNSRKGNLYTLLCSHTVLLPTLQSTQWHIILALIMMVDFVVFHVLYCVITPYTSIHVCNIMKDVDSISNVQHKGLQFYL